MTVEELLESYRPAWMDDAFCRKRGVELTGFFPERGQATGAYARVRPFCLVCEVRPKCLRYIMDYEGDAGHQQRHGYWAAMSPREREALYRKRAA